MSNSQRRTAFRQRRKAHPGPHDGESSYSTPSYQMGVRIQRLAATLRRSRETERRRENAARPIPTSGSRRRRAKAERNRAAVYERWPELRPRAIGTANEVYSGSGTRRVGIAHHEEVLMGTVVTPTTFEPIDG